MKKVLIKRTIIRMSFIFIVGLIIIQALRLGMEPTSNRYNLPIAKYETLDSDHFSVTIKIFKDENAKELEWQYATIAIFQHSDSIISFPEDAIIPFQIKGTDLKGKAQLGSVTKIDGPAIHSEELHKLVKNKEQMTVVLENYEEVHMIYRTPQEPSM